MSYEGQVGSNSLKSEVIDAVVKQVAERSYKFMQAVAVVSTNAWKNTFFREQTAIPSGQSGNSQKGVPRGANFPQYSIGWDEISVRIVKHAIEENVAWETLLSDDINVQARTTIKLTQAITKSVDDDIWTSLTENLTPVLINSFTNAGYYWNATSAAIINDLMTASRKIAENYYDTSDLMCFVSSFDKQNIMNYLTSKGAQFPSIATGVVENGIIGKLAGITLVESQSVTASYALVVKPKTCATFKQLVPLTTNVTEDPLKSWRIRIVQEGIVELTDPKAVCLIIRTT
jgi:hypothetical protein